MSRILLSRPPAHPMRAPAIAATLALALAGAALIVVLGSAWTADFRYTGARNNATLWAPEVSAWESACRDSASGVIMVRAPGDPPTSLPCARLRF